MKQFVLENISWSVEPDALFDSMDLLSEDKMARLLGLDAEDYKNLPLEKKKDLVFTNADDIVEKYPDGVSDLFNLPDTVEIPNEVVERIESELGGRVSFDDIDSVVNDVEAIFALNDWLCEENAFYPSGWVLGANEIPLNQEIDL